MNLFLIISDIHLFLSMDLLIHPYQPNPHPQHLFHLSFTPNSPTSFEISYLSSSNSACYFYTVDSRASIRWTKIWKSFFVILKSKDSLLDCAIYFLYFLRILISWSCFWTVSFQSFNRFYIMSIWDSIECVRIYREKITRTMRRLIHIIEYFLIF